MKRFPHLVLAAVPASAADVTFPGDMECVPQQFYRHRADGTSGREIFLNFKGAKLVGVALVVPTCDGKAETTALPAVVGDGSMVNHRG